MSNRKTQSRYEDVRSALREDLPAWGVLVFESHHASEFTMQWRTHSFAKVVFILEGSGRFDVGENAFEFVAGDVIFVPSQTKNRICDNQADPVSLYAACISDQVLQCDPTMLDRWLPRHFFKQPRRSLAIASVLRRMVLTQDQGSVRSSGRQSIEMLTDAWRLLSLVAEVADKPPKQQSAGGVSTGDVPTDELISKDIEVVRQYAETLRTHFLDAGTIDTAAETCGLSRRTFTRLFREVTGTTWLGYVRQIAIDHASDLLRETYLPILSVAFEAGFSDLSTFYRQFTRRVGQSPACYRESNHLPDRVAESSTEASASSK
ncbi:helix-turn-helix domain-containing protein [Neorhodopirellula lusitana]|uniref:helix-turn-helix domain-containing protein n=1 Tax=Neorhodopirellula lusitana TaxID=445327 RepID=UPI00384C0198